MAIRRLLIANRGEIALRIARAAAELEIETVAVYSADDARALHVNAADQAHALQGAGPKAYLSIQNVIGAARETGCDAIHPGYGLMSESAEFATACADGGTTFVGPSAVILEQLGDKAKARSLAKSVGVAVLEGANSATTLDQARSFFQSTQSPIVVKAIAGGGGRGMGVVSDVKQLAEIYERCQGEAVRAFGNGALYVERFLPRARHIEVQIAGDGERVAHLWERECTIQRRNQKLIEVAPAPNLDASVRDRILEAAIALARAVKFTNIGTFEFLLDTETAEAYFIEANPRIQVEHTITEEITGIDLVQLQLKLASGKSFVDLGISQESVREPVHSAIQLRINGERIGSNGDVRPSTGTITVFEPPTGPGVRVDTHAFTGHELNPRFDSLLAKLIVRSGGTFEVLVKKSLRALDFFRIEGVESNIELHRAILSHPNFTEWNVTTGFIAENLAELIESQQQHQRASHRFTVGEKAARDLPSRVEAPPNTMPVLAPTTGTIVNIDIVVGISVRKGSTIATIEALKMLHFVTAPSAGVVRAIAVAVNEMVSEGQPIVFIEVDVEADNAADEAAEIDLDHIRPDLAELQVRIDKTCDEQRPAAVEKRHRLGFLTARENLANICDADSFLEYGQLIVAAQRERRTIEDLIENTPGDGMIVGMGSVNGDQFGEEAARAAILIYDYTVLAGTQGYFNHRKTDRVLELAYELKLPVIFFTEGGGGRPGDVDVSGKTSVAGLTVPTFATFGRLSGLVPRIAVNSGRCFAGNAALFGSADVTIATKSSNIGMAGPAMIEGGGLGIVKPEDIGPIDVLHKNGVVDLVAEDEAHGARLARQVLGYFQGPLSEWTCADQRLLRHAIPENRKYVYDIRPLIETLADEGTFLELRRPYGPGMITGFIRIEGRPCGLLANDPKVLSGAIDAAGGEKAGRFIQLCDAFDLPIVSLCDTPGFMVGPESEKEAAVRRVSRMFVNGASVTVPWLMVCVRKGYGLGAQAMAGGGFHASLFTIAWPSGEFGGMGLEGAVRLGFRKELDAESNPREREKLYEKLVAQSYQRGKALNTGSFFEVDDVIDPAETRTWISRALKCVPKPKPRERKKRPCVDTW